MHFCLFEETFIMHLLILITCAKHKLHTLTPHHLKKKKKHQKRVKDYTTPSGRPFQPKL